VRHPECRVARNLGRLRRMELVDAAARIFAAGAYAPLDEDMREALAGRGG